MSSAMETLSAPGTGPPRRKHVPRTESSAALRRARRFRGDALHRMQSTSPTSSPGPMQRGVRSPNLSWRTLRLLGPAGCLRHLSVLGAHRGACRPSRWMADDRIAWTVVTDGREPGRVVYLNAFLQREAQGALAAAGAGYLGATGARARCCTSGGLSFADTSSGDGMTCPPRLVRSLRPAVSPVAS